MGGTFKCKKKLPSTCQNFVIVFTIKKMKKRNRIYQLDLFRFIAALSVVLYYYCYLFRGYAADELSNLIFSEIGGVYKYGYLGVDLFIIISIFVTSLLIKHKSISKFIISRISKLYPVYWICVSITFLGIIFFGSPRYSVHLSQFIANLTMFNNYLGIESIDGLYWTFFVEMKFYIFIIGSFLMLNKIKKIELDHLVLFWIALSLMCFFLYEFFVFKVLNYFFILNWSSYFIAGIIFYQIYTKGFSFKYITLLFLSFSTSLYHAFLKLEHFEQHFETSFSSLIVGSIIFYYYLVMLLISTNNLSVINSSRLTSLGMLTYPLYLIYQNVGFILLNKYEDYFNKYTLVLLIIIMILVSGFSRSKPEKSILKRSVNY